VNQTGREELPGLKFVPVKRFLNCAGVILRVMEENSATEKSKPGVFFEADYNRMQEILSRIAVIVRECHYISLRHGPSPIASPG
jgi:hypothetical protein